MNMNIRAFGRLANLDIEFRCADGPEGEWRVTHFGVDEALDRPYAAQIELSSPVEFDVHDLLGADGELALLRGAVQTRTLYGVIARVEHLGFADHCQRVLVEIVPALALLDQGLRSRIFQDKSVQDIVAEVLDAGLAPYGRSVDFGAVSRGVALRDYCVQYRESDFDFVCRLLEEEGISYAFGHELEAGVEAVHLRDANAQHPELESADGSTDIPVISTAADEADVESIQAIAWAEQLTVTSTARMDYDWLTPTSPLASSAGEADERGRERRIYVHGRRRFIEDEQAERVGDRLESEQREATSLAGQSNASILVPGGRFNLVHDTLDIGGEYLVTAVRHEFAREDGGAQTYHNSFECIPYASPWRPRPLTPKPRVQGPQTGIVVGDEEIHTDEHGRIQVQLHWEEAPSYATGATCWMRCAQTWAGPGWGAQFIPRVGMEVIVEFLESNPDRPIVMGCVYNGDNATPFVLPDNKTQSGWRTSSSPGGDGYNMIRFEDSAGNEEIHVHGQKDWTIVIENDKAQEVRHDERLDVTNDRSKHVGHDELEAIDNDRTIKVGNNHSEEIGVDMDLSVGSNQTVMVGSNRIEVIGVTATETVGAAKSIIVGGVMSLSVGAMMTTSVAGSSSTSVSGSESTSIGGSSAELVTGSKSLSAENISEEAKKDMTVAVGKKMRLTSGGTLSIVGDDKAIIDIAKELVLKCGKASITLKKNGDIKIEGKKIEIKGSGDVKIKGSKILNN
jgi:type VI secretion system secreted protein VgrG